MKDIRDTCMLKINMTDIKDFKYKGHHFLSELLISQTLLWWTVKSRYRVLHEAKGGNGVQAAFASNQIDSWFLKHL